ncbi:MAG: ribosome maturation factor RimM [Rhizobiaceae bacterium]|nr:ribosome maturation factor RimM [Rhizobiaceae bacterium]
MSDTKNTMVVMAQIGRAQGLKGEVRATSHTRDPLALGDYGPLSDGQGRLYKVNAIRPASGGANQVVVKFAGVNDRTGAETLNGVVLMVPRAALPAPDDEDDFYHADLIGLEARDMSGTPLGRITAVHDFGAGDMLDIAVSGGKTVSVPFTRAAVPEVKVAEGFVTVDPVLAGLGPDGDDERRGGADGTGS